jgi:4-carboxymuconolactone decarboxylase
MGGAHPTWKETTMADAPDYLARGREVAGKLWGARAGGQELPAQKLAPEFFALVAQFVFGMFWSRPNLDLRSRSLCTVAQLAALGKTEELRGHLMGARNLGITREELIEVLMQTACYAGVPAAVNALNAAADVLGT